MRRMSLLVLLMAGLFLLAPGLPASAADLQESLNTFLSALPADFETIPPQNVSAKLNAGENLFVLDVREPAEYQAGHIEGAVNIPIRTLAQNLSKLPADKGTPVAVVCKSGIRAAYGTMTLKLVGYKNVKDISGGMLAWEKEGLPLKK
jgi:rhodanese-related sulfurtransferase